MSYVPSFEDFKPVIPYQRTVLTDIRRRFDYSKGKHELLLSGSVGSAKSIIMAHIGLTHVLMNQGAQLLLGRKSMPALKRTIFQMILDHIGERMVEGKDYKINRTQAEIEFSNRSKIHSFSWSDKAYKKVRSVPLSAAIIEELTENNDEDKQAYDEISMRVGRVLDVEEKFIISATNPDAPSHWVHNYFIDNPSPRKHVYYSVTSENPFLPDGYIDSLLETLDEKTAQRMVYGKWVEIDQERVYHSYSSANKRMDQDYEVIPSLPIYISFDFNIAKGKPMSACAHQVQNNQIHFFNEFVVHGADTEDLMEEIAGSDILENNCPIVIHGDATGKSRDTRSKKSDYTIIEKYLANYRRKDGRRVQFEIDVPTINPPVRSRHNMVNGLMRNANGKHRLFVYKRCKVLDEGFRLVQLKAGGNYVEDDSKEYQHVTTAAGYSACRLFQAKQAIKTAGRWAEEWRF